MISGAVDAGMRRRRTRVTISAMSELLIAKAWSDQRVEGGPRRESGGHGRYMSASITPLLKCLDDSRVN